MGAETTHRTRKAFLDAVRSRAVQILDKSIEADKETEPIPRWCSGDPCGAALGQIECRVYDKDKFHAKAYITHAKLEVVGSQALVGSSNFTAPGLTKNIELNVQIQSAREVGAAPGMVRGALARGEPSHRRVIETIERHIRLLHAIRCLCEGAPGVLPRP